jgi:hypothetical protein
MANQGALLASSEVLIGTSNAFESHRYALVIEPTTLVILMDDVLARLRKIFEPVDASDALADRLGLHQDCRSRPGGIPDLLHAIPTHLNQFQEFQVDHVSAIAQTVHRR